MTSPGRSVGGWLALGVVALALPAAVVAAPSPAPDAGGSETGNGTAGSPGVFGQVSEADAASLYVANCASCHGPQGEGTTVGPTLVGVGAASADFYLRTGRMPLGAPGQQPTRHDPIFTDEQIQALVAYVASFGDGPPIPQVGAGGDVHEGWRLYTANCAACHAATGSGNAVGGGNTAVGLGRAAPTTIAEAMVIGPGAMPVFGFEPEQRDAIVAYVRYLQESPSPGGLPIGGFGPVSEGFVAVAIGLVLLVLASMFVGRRSHRGEPADAIPPAGGIEGARSASDSRAGGQGA